MIQVGKVLKWGGVEGRGKEEGRRGGEGGQEKVVGVEKRGRGEGKR
jgi:hypothetical protein